MLPGSRGVSASPYLVLEVFLSFSPASATDSMTDLIFPEPECREREQLVHEEGAGHPLPSHTHPLPSRQCLLISIRSADVTHLHESDLVHVIESGGRSMQAGGRASEHQTSDHGSQLDHDGRVGTQQETGRTAWETAAAVDRLSIRHADFSKDV